MQIHIDEVTRQALGLIIQREGVRSADDRPATVEEFASALLDATVLTYGGEATEVIDHAARIVATA